LIHCGVELVCNKPDCLKTSTALTTYLNCLRNIQKLKYSQYIIHSPTEIEWPTKTVQEFKLRGLS